MNGQHISGTPIVVDFWRSKDVPPRSLFFLSHMHADHTSGLSERWLHPIHCTPTTAKLLIRKFKIDPKLVVELEENESRILRVNCPGDTVSITVTTLDANHCPGSAMFLFEGYFGTILYTGDFRFCPSMLQNPILNGSRAIDVLYLDNTYCDPKCQFPTRDEAAEQMMSLIAAAPDKLVIIGFHTLGKEDLLVKIARRFETHIGVSEEQYKTLEILKMPDVFTVDMENTSIRVLPFYMVSKNLLAEMKNGALAILPTCLYTGQGALEPPSQDLIKVVPYSDHSSFDELREFVRSVRPRCVRPIVKSFSGDRSSVGLLRGNMSVFDDLLDPTPTPDFELPKGIQKLFSAKSSAPALPTTPQLQGGGNSVPKLKRSGSASRSLRNRPKGVQYISPVKLNPRPPFVLESSSGVSETNTGSIFGDLNQKMCKDRGESVAENSDSKDSHHVIDVRDLEGYTEVSLIQQCLELQTTQPPSSARSSNGNPMNSSKRKAVSISLESESDSSCQRTSTFNPSSERVTCSKSSYTCVRVQPIENLQLRRINIDVVSVSPKKDNEALSSLTLAAAQLPDVVKEGSSVSSNPPKGREETTNVATLSSLLEVHPNVCDNVISPESVHTTPLLNALQQFYGNGPATREVVTKHGENNKRINTQTEQLATSKINPDHKVNTDHKEPYEMQTNKIKRPRLSSPEGAIYPSSSDTLLAVETTNKVKLEEENGSVLGQLEGVGLLQKLREIDLSSPVVLRIMHTALNAAESVTGSSCSNALLSNVHVSLPLGCHGGCECDGEKICLRGLEEFIHQDDNDDWEEFMEFLVTHNPF